MRNCKHCTESRKSEPSEKLKELSRAMEQYNPYLPDYKKMYEGMQDSRRFQAAVAAMQGILAGDSQSSSMIKPEKLANIAIEYADALLAELDKKEDDK